MCDEVCSRRDTIGYLLLFYSHGVNTPRYNSSMIYRNAGRPPIRSTGTGKVGMSFKVDKRLKNLLVDISAGYDVSMTELLLMLALKEAGLESLDEVEEHGD